jgi:hypothetical protein
MKLTKKKKWIFGLSFTIILLGSLFFLWQFPIYQTLMPGYHSVIYTPKRYNALLKIQKQERLISDTSISNQQKLFTKQITELFPYWYGTHWNFNGTTEIPGKGSIACGYFVTTVLQQTGLKIQKNTLAQMGSEQMMKEICDDKNLFRFTNYSMFPFLQKIKQLGKGIYIVGLDNHTGFIWNDGDEIYFVHASGRFPYCVKKEKVAESITIWKSKYKVISKISSDTLVLNKWLNGKIF